MIGTKNLETKLQTEINSGGHTDIELAQLAQACSALETSFVPSVANFASLPTASNNLGKSFYVENVGKYYFSYSDGWDQIKPDTVTNRQLYAWGAGSFGKLGDGTTTNRCVPTQECTAATNWCAVEVGENHTAALKTNGTLYAWGYNADGRLGDGTITCKLTPTQESTSATNWCAVSAGRHTAAIKTTGELYAWGCGAYGGLGDGTTVDKCVPTQECTAATNWCAVSAGKYYTIAIKTTGALYAWGYNFWGNLGDGTTVDKCVPTQESTAATDWCAVAAGVESHTAAIKTNGTLYAWGCNGQGRLGDGTTTNRCVPTQESTAATDWCAVGGGQNHTAAVKTTGELYAWGDNFYGQLGDGTVVNRSVPTQESTSATNWCAVAAGQCHNAAIKTTGALYAWGRNNCGLLGDGTITCRCVPTQESTAATDWCAVGAGESHTAAIRVIIS